MCTLYCNAYKQIYHISSLSKKKTLWPNRQATHLTMHLISLLAQYYYNCYYILHVLHYFMSSCYHVSDFEVFHFLLLLLVFLSFYSIQCVHICCNFKLHTSVHLCVYFSVYGLLIFTVVAVLILLVWYDEIDRARARAV